MNIIAHRGYSGKYPENTISAYDAAFATVAQGVECDARLTRDGHIVLLHDPSTGRVGDRDLIVNQSTLDELRTVEIRSGERLALLSELLQHLPPDRIIYIELKCNEVLNPVAQLLAGLNMKMNRVTFIGFDMHVDLRLVKKMFPGVTVHRLIDLNLEPPQSTGKMLERALRDGLDGLQIGRSTRSCLDVVTAEFISTVHMAGLAVQVWTVNDPAYARELKRMGVDGITTDMPEAICSAIGIPGRNARV